MTLMFTFIESNMPRNTDGTVISPQPRHEACFIARIIIASALTLNDEMMRSDEKASRRKRGTGASAISHD